MSISANFFDGFFQLFEGNSGIFFPLVERFSSIFPVGDEEVVAAYIRVVPFCGDALSIGDAALQASGSGWRLWRTAVSGEAAKILLYFFDERFRVSADICEDGMEVAFRFL